MTGKKQANGIARNAKQDLLPKALLSVRICTSFTGMKEAGLGYGSGSAYGSIIKVVIVMQCINTPKVVFFTRCLYYYFCK
jgi:hypothetical protein